MNKRDHCSKKMIPMIASKLRHPKVDPVKVMNNSEYIANAVYNKLGDNALPNDVDNALIEVITACGIGQRNVLGVNCEKITTEGFANNMKNKMKSMPGEKSKLLPIIFFVVAVLIILCIVKKYMLKK